MKHLKTFEQKTENKPWLKPSGDKSWPTNLRLGGGAKGVMLLNDVPLGYEFWRILNGFPPDFYQPKNSGQKEMNQKEEGKK